MHGTIQRLQEPPEHRRASMAQYRALPTGEHCRHEPSVFARRRVPHGVDPAVKTMKAPRANPKSHAVLPDSKRLKLSDGHHPVLSPCDPRELHLRLGDFLPHAGEKVAKARLVSPYAEEISG